jgi:tetratricopeptide (TPR) repeat protein
LYEQAYNNRGFAYKSIKEYDLAIEDYTTAIKLNPNPETAYNNRGYAFYDKKEYDLAIEDYNKAIQLDPISAYVYKNRSLAYKKLGKTAEAEADMKKYEELTKNQKP